MEPGSDCTAAGRVAFFYEVSDVHFSLFPMSQYESLILALLLYVCMVQVVVWTDSSL